VEGYRQACIEGSYCKMQEGFCYQLVTKIIEKEDTGNLVCNQNTVYYYRAPLKINGKEYLTIL
jgi:hypothetical protein